jgi:hypothetical protein
MSNGDPSVDRLLQRGLAKAIARSWKDEDYRDRLLADPRAALAELGVEVPEGTLIRVVPDDLIELPLPSSDSQWDEQSATADLERLFTPRP